MTRSLSLAFWCRRKPPLDLLGDDLGLIVLAIASAVDDGDRAQSGCGREIVQRLRLFRLGEFRLISRLELLPALRVVAEPLAELGARAEVSFPRVEPQMLFCPAAWPDAIDQDAATVFRTRLIVRTLQANVRSS